MPCINFINDNFTKTQLKDKQIPELFTFYYFAPLLQCNKMRNILNGLRIYIYCH